MLLSRIALSRRLARPYRRWHWQDKGSAAQTLYLAARPNGLGPPRTALGSVRTLHRATNAGAYEADCLVVALGADYAYEATPGLAEDDSFYSLAGAARLSGVIPSFAEGHAVIGVCGLPYKCTPAPSECALLLHDELVRRGVRDDCQISYVVPQPNPVPPSPDAAGAVLEAFGDSDITFVPGRRVASLDRVRRIATLDDGTQIACDLFLGVPKHRAPQVVLDSGMAVDGYIPVEKATLATRYPGVYALGDCATVGVPKAGAFAEGAPKPSPRN